MDDRKRPAPDDHSASRVKRQAVAVNGAPVKAEDDLPRDDDLDRFTKDAILRQMKEYKREKHSLETQLAQVNKRSAYHDDHLRIIDGWFLQLLDELSLLRQSEPHLQDSDRLEFSTSLLSAEPKKFQEHLGERSDQIKTSITNLFANATPVPPDVKRLQEKLSALLAAEKVHNAELQRAISERNSLDDRLFSATNRYMTAEKQLDRAKSAQVAKLEAQAMALNKTETKAEPEVAEGTPERGLTQEAVAAAKREAQAITAKQTEQLEKLAEENKKLMAELTAAQIKVCNISDDDYANSDLFKQIKSQHADVVKRINDLEARNIELREETKTLQAERTEYRDKVDNEFRDQDVAMQSEIAQKDADLTRVRGQRDELIADLAVQKSTVDAHKESHDRFKELAEARQSRIAALESEVERLRIREQEEASNQKADGADEESSLLRSKLKVLESEKASLDQELRSMETAYRKASALAATKINDLLHQEERLRQNFEEKAKADQKYFSARKLMDSREAQFRDMQKQVIKSSEIISTLKDSESSCRAIIINLEKQLAESKDSLQLVTNQHRTSQQLISDHKAVSDRLSQQADELKKLLSTKDDSMVQARKAQREAELSAESLKLEVAQTTKESQTWKEKALSNQGDDMLVLKKLLYCTVCDENIKDTALKTCKHVMCRHCIERQIKNRERRCPICATPYGMNDHMQITL